ncbi:MAG: hypothetical protein O3C40_21745 [Planctomycetota bacterium]|nr:hypothetical protein [Planctomycetota bacterium]
MAQCASCGTMILFGGERFGDLRFCNKACLGQSVMVNYGEEIPPEIVAQRALQIREGSCPNCNGSGPIDLQFGHTIVSVLVMTQWNTKPLLGCRSCGLTHQLKSFAICLFGGWWGFPWGLIGTPIQLIRNLAAAYRGVPAEPSAELRQLALAELGAELDRKTAEFAAQGVVDAEAMGDDMIP